MKISGPILLLLCCAAVAPASDIGALIEEARSTPPEIASDALIRIAATSQVDTPRKIQLLQDAFERAPGGPLPYRRRVALARNDGLAAYWNRVYAQDLDALTLQVRAVSAMLPLDANKARELFLRIPPLKLPRLKCEEYLVYDVGNFYELLESMARDSPEAGQFLKPYAAAVASAVQISPMLRVILAAKLKDADLEAVTNELAAALGKVSGDDRSFTYAQTVGSDILQVVDELKRRKLSPLRLVEAYRLYLVWNLSSPRCADDDLMLGGKQSFGLATGQPVVPQPGDFISFFNTKLRMPPLQPIGEAESTPSHIEGAATGLRLCQEAECRAMVEKLRGVVLRENGVPYRPNERGTPEWQGRLRALLASLEQWNPNSGETSADFFRDKAQLYSELFNLTADGPGGELVMRSLLNFARSSEMRKTNRLEWFLPVNAVLARMSLDPMGLGKYAEEVRHFKDPLIGFSARLEAAAPRTPERVLPLL